MAADKVISNIEHRLVDTRADWARRGYGFEYWIDPPGQIWRDFVHKGDGNGQRRQANQKG